MAYPRANNACSFIGNLTRDPKKTTRGKSGTPVAYATIAVDCGYQGSDGWVDKVSYVDVSVSGESNVNAFCKRAGKGVPVAVICTMSVTSTGKEEGYEKKYYFEVVAWQVLAKKKSSADDNDGGYEDEESGGEWEGDDPFAGEPF